MIRFLVMTACCVFSASAMAYDSTWYKSDYWSGEYPAGFQVYKKGIVVQGRKNLDENEAPSVKCVLKRNKYSAAKALPKAEYVEMTKILPMVAKQDIAYQTSAFNEETKDFVEYTVDIKKGDIVEYLANYSEGSFKARFNGNEFDASQDLLENLETPEFGQEFTPVDNWINLSCVNNVSVWLKLSDLQTEDGEGWIDGVRYFFFNPYN